jgi:hypothetical protein
MFKKSPSIKQLIALQLVQFVTLMLVAINDLSIALIGHEATFRLVLVSLMITTVVTFAKLQSANGKLA